MQGQGGVDRGHSEGNVPPSWPEWLYHGVVLRGQIWGVWMFSGIETLQLLELYHYHCARQNTIAQAT